MTEQQIDAELCRYAAHPSRGTWSWWLYELEFSPLRDKSDVRPAVFAHLTGGYFAPESGTRYYPTREAAFADLRRAIALTPASE